MSKIIIAFLMVSTFFLISSCDKSTSECNYIVEVSEKDFMDGPYYSSTKVQNLTWDGTCLTVTFSYAGGCEDHSYDFVSDGSIAESLPPIITLGLIHDNTDNCDALITESVTVDILDLPQLGDYGSIVFKFKGDDSAGYLIEL